MSMPWFRTRRRDDRHTRRQLDRRRRFSVEALEGRQMLSTVVVSNTADSGSGSLRQAIIAADANTSSTPTTIDFNIPGAYLHTIGLQSSLPTITEPVIIDGTSQPGYFGSPLITLDGSGAGSLAVGLDVIASNSTIKGLAINNFSADGVLIYEGSNDVVTNDFIGVTTPGPVGPGPLTAEFRGNTPAGNGFDGVSLEYASGDTISNDVISANGQNGVYLFDSSANTVSGDFIGTDSSGYTALPNGQDGLLAAYGSANNTIGGLVAGSGNVISGNGQWGVYLTDSGTKGNVVEGNDIGTNAAGTAALPNGNNGVDIVSGASFNTIGGTGAGSANVISGNAYNGVVIAFAGASENLVEGNLIGTNASGTAALPNGDNGVEIQGGATSNTIGGTTAAALNVISGNGYAGVLITDSGTSGNVVEGDYIGTNAAGTGAVANLGHGVVITAGATANTIGGTTAGARDLLSGNVNNGVALSGSTTSGNVVEGDYIGTNAAGTAPLGNGADGVFFSGATDNTIGGTVAGARDVISGNAWDGVHIVGTGTTGNVVEGDYIGTNAAGNAALANGGSGVAIFAGASSNTIGGSTSLDRNVISGNAYDGVYLSDSGTDYNDVQYDFIGTDATGNSAVFNGTYGVIIQSGAYNNDIYNDVISANGSDGVDINGPGTDANYVFYSNIGLNAAGTAAVIHPGLSYSNVVGVQISNGASGNVLAYNTISGNLIGVEIDGSNSTNNGIYFSRIGTDATGSYAVGNIDYGVFLYQTSGNLVYGNTIAFNTYFGLVYSSSAAGQDSNNNLYDNGFANEVTE